MLPAVVARLVDVRPRGWSMNARIFALISSAMLAVVSSTATGLESVKHGAAESFRVDPARSQPLPGFESARLDAPIGETVFRAGSLAVHFVDVGQGDSEFIELPDGRTALIDGGPPNGRIAEFLSRRGVTRIDHLVLTHPHLDHYGGLHDVFDRFEVAHFYDTRADNGGADDDRLRAKAAAEPGITVSYPRPGESLDWGSEVGVKVFNSCPDEQAVAERRRDVNACSITLKLTHQGASLLFTGDIGAGVEAILAARYGDELSAHVLKVGHHGSATSSSAPFLEKVRPQVSYIEVGAGNSYGHPRQETVGRLQASGSEVRRTDQGGTFSISDHRPSPRARGPLPVLLGE